MSQFTELRKLGRVRLPTYSLVYVTIPIETFLHILHSYKYLTKYLCVTNNYTASLHSDHYGKVAFMTLQLLLYLRAIKLFTNINYFIMDQ